jgi:protein TonB
MVRRSFSGAFGLSAVTHAAIFVLIAFITARMPDPTASRQTPSAGIGEIIWIPRPGPGGGGGGGGVRTPAPPRRVEAPGVDRSTVRPRVDIPPQPQQAAEPPTEPVVEIEAVPTAAGITELPGVITSMPSASISLGPGTGGGAGSGRQGGIGPGDGGGYGPGQDRGSGGGPYQPGANGVTFPRLIGEVVPTYTNAALQARVQGTVELNAVVRADGRVGDVWVVRSLDRTFGIDDEAVRTVKQWRFEPATLNGKPVPVVVPIELRFTIR